MTDDDDLQFDKAEFEKDGQTTARAACVSCKQQLGDQYYVVNDHIVCSPCGQELSVSGAAGTPIGRLVRALAAGLVGAAVGAGIYFAIVKLTGYEIGLVAIAVGWLVGAGVRLGANGRGGWLYQGLAIVITYAAIVLTYVPFIVQQFDAGYLPTLEAGSANVAKITVTQQQTVLLNGNNISIKALGAELEQYDAADGEVWYHREAMADEQPGEVAVQVAELVYGNGLRLVPFRDHLFDQPELWSEMVARGGGGQKLAAGLTLFIVAAMAPFMMLPDNIIGLLIIGFALFQAWQMNKRVALDIKGPFQLTELGG